jgi:hypothetical protein
VPSGAAPSSRAVPRISQRPQRPLDEIGGVGEVTPCCAGTGSAPGGLDHRHRWSATSPICRSPDEINEPERCTPFRTSGSVQDQIGHTYGLALPPKDETAGRWSDTGACRFISSEELDQAGAPTPSIPTTGAFNVSAPVEPLKTALP